MTKAFSGTFGFLIFLISSVACAAGSQSPEAATLACVGDAAEGLPFLEAYLQKKLSATALEEACSELDPKTRYIRMQEADGAWYHLAVLLGYGVAGQFAGSFSRLQNSETQRNYMLELKKIKEIPDPMARIQKVYALAAAHQGKYDLEIAEKMEERGHQVLAFTPENILDSVEEYGSSGVCRQFAALLQWSLHQVARWSHSESIGLSENDFSAELMTGKVEIEKGRVAPHAWVRIHLPKQDQVRGGIRFGDFDLDTTWYPHDFTPLMPRKVGLPLEEGRGVHAQCKRVLSCLKAHRSEPAASVDVFPHLKNPDLLTGEQSVFYRLNDGSIANGQAKGWKREEGSASWNRSVGPRGVVDPR